MAYQVLWASRTVQKAAAKFELPVREALAAVIAGLQENPRPNGYEALTAKRGYKVRIGSHRLIYEVDDKAQIVTLLHFDDRKQVYKRGR